MNRSALCLLVAIAVVCHVVSLSVASPVAGDGPHGLVKRSPCPICCCPPCPCFQKPEKPTWQWEWEPLSFPGPRGNFPTAN